MTEHYLVRLSKTIAENWDNPALTDFYLTEDGTARDVSRGNRYTYGEMYGKMLGLAGMFRRLGIQKGDHVAICGSNSANWAVAYLAIAAYQGVVVTVLHSQTTDDIADQLEFSDAVALFTDIELWEELKERNFSQLHTVISLEDYSVLCGMKAELSVVSIKPLDCQLSHGSLDDLAMICFTSGSTSVSKGVMLTYRNISATIISLVTIFPLKMNKNILSYLPLSHMYGLLGDILSQLCQGSSIFISIYTSFKIIDTINIVRPFQLLLVPTLLKNLLNCISIFEQNGTIKAFDYVLVGGAVTNSEEVHLLRNKGFRLTIGYGMTETTSLVSCINPAWFRENACGKIVDEIQVMFSPEGEILVKGENVMLGYYKNPEATAQKIDKDGWLHTGDAGWLDDDGYLYVTGRLGQDMIVLPNGENIHPEDIETKLNVLPEVKESVVVAREGKLVALVVLNDGECCDNQETNILNLVNPQLPLFSQLDKIEFLSEPIQYTAKHTIKRYLYK